MPKISALFTLSTSIQIIYFTKWRWWSRIIDKLTIGVLPIIPLLLCLMIFLRRKCVDLFFFKLDLIFMTMYLVLLTMYFVLLKSRKLNVMFLDFRKLVRQYVKQILTFLPIALNINGRKGPSSTMVVDIG